jgi:small subunit ribosomal protein S15
MPASAEHKAEIVKAHARAATDTGSTEVQVALLTDRINELTPHFQDPPQGPSRPPRPAEDGQPQEKPARVSEDTDAERYTALIQKLGLRK